MEDIFTVLLVHISEALTFTRRCAFGNEAAEESEKLGKSPTLVEGEGREVVGVGKRLGRASLGRLDDGQRVDPHDEDSRRSARSRYYSKDEVVSLVCRCRRRCYRRRLRKSVGGGDDDEGRCVPCRFELFRHAHTRARLFLPHLHVGLHVFPFLSTSTATPECECSDRPLRIVAHVFLGWP